MKSSLIACAFFISMFAVASCVPGDDVSESPPPAVSAEELMVDGPRYEDETSLVFPTDYREWPFIGSGLGLTYDEEARRRTRNRGRRHSPTSSSIRLPIADSSKRGYGRTNPFSSWNSDDLKPMLLPTTGVDFKAT